MLLQSGSANSNSVSESFVDFNCSAYKSDANMVLSLLTKMKSLSFCLSNKLISDNKLSKGISCPTEPIYEFSNALYFFDKEYFFKNGRYWDWEEVNFFEVSSKIELLDVDTEDDFKIAEALWGI